MSTVATLRLRGAMRRPRSDVDTCARVGDVGWALKQESLLILLGAGQSLANLTPESQPQRLRVEEYAYLRLLALSEASHSQS